MKVSCDVINEELLKLLPKDQMVIKYVEFCPNIEGDEEGMTSLFGIVTVDKENEIHLYKFNHYPGDCVLYEPDNGKRWFVNACSTEKS